MQINITGHHMEVTDALKNRITDAVGKLEHQGRQAIDHAHVTLEVSRQSHHCGITMAMGSDQYAAKDEADDMYTAIDRATDKLRRQIQADKSRQKEARRR